MRMRLCGATAVAIATTMLGALVGAAPTAAADTTWTTWPVDLAAGDAVGVVVDGGTARLADEGTFAAPAAEGSPESAGAPPIPIGLLTFPAHELPDPTTRVTAQISGDAPGATVDVRGRRANGNWTEWVPADATGTVELPEPTRHVQGRLVLSGPGEVDELTLSAQPLRGAEGAPEAVEAAPLSYRVFATREGLVGGTTANGHVIVERDHFVALPSRRALSPKGSHDYSVKVCAPNGRCAFAPVWDVGPWNTRDDYWNPPDVRQEWKDLPQGTPEAQAAYRDGYNGGKDQFGRTVKNPAGIDLADGTFWDDLGLKDNSWVTVEYLWTGSVRLSRVASDATAAVYAAPDPASEIVGIAAGDAGVPVHCRLVTAVGEFLQIGLNQFLDAAVVPDAGDVAPCAAVPEQVTLLAAAAPVAAMDRTPTAVPPAALDRTVVAAGDPAVDESGVTVGDVTISASGASTGESGVTIDASGVTNG